MGLFGFGGKESNLVVVIYEGPGKLRLNGNRKRGKDAVSARKGASTHDGTVCWVEFSMAGGRLAEGKGPSATKLPPGEADRFLREFHLHPSVRAMLADLEAGRDRSSKLFKYDDPNQVTKPT